MNNQNKQEVIANALWAQSLSFRKHSIGLGIASIILFLLGMILLLIGLYVPFKVPIDQTYLYYHWCDFGSIYIIPYGFPPIPTEGKVLRAIAIIGSVLFYIVIILLAFLAWTLPAYFIKRYQALELKPSLTKITASRLLKQQIQDQLQNTINTTSSSSPKDNEYNSANTEIESLKKEISKLKKNLQQKKNEE